MEVDLKVQNEKVCEKSYRRNYLRQSMICVGDENNKKATYRVSVVLGFELGMRLGQDGQVGSQVGDEGD